MFDRYMNAKREKPRKWVGVTVTVSIIAHVIGGLALVAYSFWKIEKLQTKGTQLSFFAASAQTPPPPPPPPPPPASAVVKTDKKIVKVHKTTEVMQPPKEPPKPPDKDTQFVPDNGGSEGGEGEGDPNGEEGGEEGGEPDQEPVKEVKKEEPPPQQIAQQMIEGQRVAGEEQIQPPESVKQLVTGQGIDKVKMKAKVCFDASGKNTMAQITKSSGYPELDEKVRNELTRWRYRPYSVNGKAVPFCFPLNFKWEFSSN